jgi:hypothetical protein
MLKWIAVGALTLAFLTPAHATVPPVSQANSSMITEAAFGCGPGRTRIRGVCVSRARVRQVRRCIRWRGGVCRAWAWRRF